MKGRGGRSFGGAICRLCLTATSTKNHKMGGTTGRADVDQSKLDAAR